MSYFSETYAASLKNAKFDSRVERMAQLIAASHGFESKARAKDFEEAALAALDLAREFYLPK